MTLVSCLIKKGLIKLRFTVSDTGRGMSEEFLKKIYLPFEQENLDSVPRLGSTGLGMAITKNLVTLLGGTISVKSRLDEGALCSLLNFLLNWQISIVRP